MKNSFPGVNPHLNSHLQSKGGSWEMFHGRFIEKLLDALEDSLSAAYYAASKQVEYAVSLTDT